MLVAATPKAANTAPTNFTTRLHKSTKSAVRETHDPRVPQKRTMADTGLAMNGAAKSFSPQLPDCNEMAKTASGTLIRIDSARLHTRGKHMFSPLTWNKVAYPIT